MTYALAFLSGNINDSNNPESESASVGTTVFNLSNEMNISQIY